jgi:hypothetical protein
VGVGVVRLVVSVLVVVLEEVVVVVVGSMGAAYGDVSVVEEGGRIEEVLDSISGFGSVFVPG